VDSGHLFALHSFPVGSVALLSLPFLLPVAFLCAIRNVTTHELLLVHTLGAARSTQKKRGTGQEGSLGGLIAMRKKERPEQI